MIKEKRLTYLLVLFMSLFVLFSATNVFANAGIAEGEPHPTQQPYSESNPDVTIQPVDSGYEGFQPVEPSPFYAIVSVLSGISFGLGVLVTLAGIVTLVILKLTKSELKVGKWILIVGIILVVLGLISSVALAYLGSL